MKMKSPSELNLLNFSALYDTTRAIYSELDILPKERVYIDGIPKNLDSSLALALSSQTFSGNTLGDLRYKAIQYLQECKYIKSFEYKNDGFGGRHVEISLDPEHFIEFFSELEKIYDNRWKDYEKIGSKKQEKNAPLFNFEKEKNTINNINSGTQHRSFRDKWLNIKRVFNVIEDAVMPSPIGGSTPEITLEKNGFFEYKIPQKREKVIYDTLSFLDKEGIITIKKPLIEDEIYTILDPKGLFLNDKVGIIINDKEILEKHLTGLSAFVNYIEKDGEERFPAYYGGKSENQKMNRQFQLEALERSLEKGLQEERIAENVAKKMQGGKKEDQQVNSDLLSIQLEKHKLNINKNTGNVSLNKVKKTLNPESKEFKALLKLATNKDYKATYRELLGDDPTKPNKRNLSFIIRNIKYTLGILPRKKALNEDIFENLKNHGYRLIT